MNANPRCGRRWDFERMSTLNRLVGSSAIACAKPTWEGFYNGFGRKRPRHPLVASLVWGIEDAYCGCCHSRSCLYRVERLFLMLTATQRNMLATTSPRSPNIRTGRRRPRRAPSTSSRANCWAASRASLGFESSWRRRVIRSSSPRARTARIPCSTRSFPTPRS